jgi:Ca2+/Na+ antiporter
LPIGGLLTAVFLQQSYSSALPDTGYMVLMDKIYVLAYGIISGVLLLVITAGNALVKGEEAIVHRIDWREAWQSTVLFLLFVIGVLLLCWGN